MWIRSRSLSFDMFIQFLKLRHDDSCRYQHQHFASYFKNNEGNNSITKGDVRSITNIEILWQGKPISTVKTFKNLNCSLCTRERLEIYKAMKLNKKNNTNFLINTLNELYGGCRHVPKFHRFCHICPKRADEAKAEKLENG